MIEKRLDIFEATAPKEKEIAEKVGWQTQTSSREPKNLHLRRAVLGPDCYLTSEGKPDPNPIHYW